MKKALIVMTVVLLAVCLTGIPVYAKAQQASFYNEQNHPDSAWIPHFDKSITGSGGKVIINVPKGKVGMVVQGMVKGLDPDTGYSVILWANNQLWYTGTPPLGNVCGPAGWLRFTTFTTNAVGRSSFHLNIDADYLAPGTYDISVWIDEEATFSLDCDTGPTINTTVLISDEVPVEFP